MEGGDGLIRGQWKWYFWVIRIIFTIIHGRMGRHGQGEEGKLDTRVHFK